MKFPTCYNINPSIKLASLKFLKVKIHAAFLLYISTALCSFETPENLNCLCLSERQIVVRNMIVVSSNQMGEKIKIHSLSAMGNYYSSLKNSM